MACQPQTMYKLTLWWLKLAKTIKHIHTYIADCYKSQWQSLDKTRIKKLLGDWRSVWDVPVSGQWVASPYASPYTGYGSSHIWYSWFPYSCSYHLE